MPIRDQPPSKIRERDVGWFGFLDSAISLYVGRIDGSGDLMEGVVKKQWLREREREREREMWVGFWSREVAERERVIERNLRESRECEI